MWKALFTFRLSIGDLYFWRPPVWPGPFCVQHIEWPVSWIVDWLHACVCVNPILHTLAMHVDWGISRRQDHGGHENSWYRRDITRGCWSHIKADCELSWEQYSRPTPSHSYIFQDSNNKILTNVIDIFMLIPMHHSPSIFLFCPYPNSPYSTVYIL